jgi:plasmid replication initiation protein
MNMPLGGKTYKVFKAAVNECMKCVITVETEPDEKGRKKWKQFTWFSETEFDEVTGKAVMTFSKKLADHLRALKWVYTKINLKDVGGLQSRYAIRIFEIIMSTAFLKGRQGNLNGQWYFQASVSDFRFILGVPADAYKQTHIMRRYVFDNPIKEINEAGIGIKLSYEGIKQGKNIVAIRITAEFTARKAQIKGKGMEETLALSTITLKTEDQRSEKELEHLKELYPEEFAALYKEAMSKHPFMPKDSEVLKLAAEGSALMKLREKYGIRK